jgi:hypothetical protein
LLQVAPMQLYLPECCLMKCSAQEQRHRIQV